MYKIDTHVHTAEVSPCGSIQAKKLVNMYGEMAYDGLIITDHYGDYFFKNHEKLCWNDEMDKLLMGYNIAKEEAKKVGLVVLLGIELNFVWSTNDYLVYGIDENFLKENKDLHKLELSIVKELIKQQGGVIYQAHPFRPGMSVVEPALLDGIEVYNGNLRHNSRNDLAFSYAKEHGLKMLSGSDFHEEEDLARGGIMTEKKITSIDEFIEILTTEDYKLISSA